MFSLDDLLLYSKQAVPTEKYRYFWPINNAVYTGKKNTFQKLYEKTGETRVVEISHVALASVKRV